MSWQRSWQPNTPARSITWSCDGNVPEEGAALEAALTRALPNAHRVLHGKVDATLAVHLGPNLLGVGVQFLNSKLPA